MLGEPVRGSWACPIDGEEKGEDIGNFEGMLESLSDSAWQRSSVRKVTQDLSQLLAAGF